ncbi:MAG: hypothetical protein V1797_07105 [Pseudomonadota bacterium]
MLAKAFACLCLSLSLVWAAPAPAAKGAPPGSAADNPASQPAGKADARPEAKKPAMQARNRLLISQPSLARLQLAVRGQAWQWRLINNWSRAQARQEMKPQDGPNLALTALLATEADPDLARLAGKLAVGAILKIARYGVVQEPTATSLRDPQPDTAAGARAGGPSHALLADGAGKTWRVQRISPNGVTVESGGTPLNKAFNPGEPYYLLSDDLDQANQWVGIVALGLDWGREQFSPEQQRAVAAWLVAQAKVFADRDGGCFDLASTRLLRLTALAGLAARGLAPGGDELAMRAHLKLWTERLHPCLDQLGVGGAWFGGTGAGAEAGYNLLQTLSAFDSSLNQRYWENNAWLRDRLAYLIQAWLPGVLASPRGGFRRLGPDGDHLSDPQDAFDLTRVQMLYLLHHRPDDPAAGYAWVLTLDRLAPRVLSDHLLFEELLAFNPEPQLTPLSLAPLQMLAPAAGRAFSRSDWSERGTWLSFLCGPHFTETQHLDAGSLLIYHQGLLLPPGGAYDGPISPHAQNYAIRSLAQNTLIIYDPQEYSWYDMREGPQRKGMYVNDGGQRSFAQFDAQGRPTGQAPWTASGLESGPAPWQGLKQLYQGGTIETMMTMPRFCYLRGNLTAAYDGSTHKAERVVRHLFHLRPGGTDDSDAAEAVVVVDDVVVGQERAQVRFVVHSAQKPELPPNLGALGPGRWRGKQDHLLIKAGPARLQVHCLLPNEAMVNLYGEVGVADSWAGDRNWPPRPPLTNPAPWRAEFEAAQASGKQRPMINVLLPSDATAPAAPKLELLKSGQADLVGVVLRDPGWPRVVAVRLGPPDPKAALSYPQPPGNTRHLVAGLAPGQPYAVQVKDGRVTLAPGKEPGQVFTSSLAGALSFVLPATKEE